MSRNVLVIVTAEGCSACNFFKNGPPGSKAPPLMQQLHQKLTGLNLQVITLNFPSLAGNLSSIDAPEKLPPQLGKYIRWYPTFILVEGNSWKDGNLQVSVFNGDISKDAVNPSTKRSPLTPDNIVQWVKTARFSKSRASLPEKTKEKPPQRKMTLLRQYD